MKRVSMLAGGAVCSLVLIFGASTARAIEDCKELPSTVRVLKKSPQCGKVPTVILSGAFKNSFSAAFRWDDGSSSGEDRSPFALDDPSAESSPYKTQRRIRKKKKTFLCYGKFLNRPGFEKPVQLTIKRTVAPTLDRFCVKFGKAAKGS